MSARALRPGSIGFTGKLLILANLFPVYGVIAHDWPIFPLILLYWLENIWLGALQLVRFAFVPIPQEFSRTSGVLGKAFLMLFFTVHYGFFCMVHGVFVLEMFGDGIHLASGSFFPTPERVLQEIERYQLEIPLLVLALSHLISLVRHMLLAGEEPVAEKGAGSLVGGIYSRIVVLHVAILLGSFVVMALDSALFALLLLIGMKTAIDYSAHRRQHAQAAALKESRRAGSLASSDG